MFICKDLESIAKYRLGCDTLPKQIERWAREAYNSDLFAMRSSRRHLRDLEIEEDAFHQALDPTDDSEIPQKLWEIIETINAQINAKRAAEKIR